MKNKEMLKRIQGLAESISFLCERVSDLEEDFFIETVSALADKISNDIAENWK